METTVDAAGSTVDPNTLSAVDWAHLIFGFLWRGLIYTIGCMIAGALVGGVVGGVLGVVMGVSGASAEQISPVATVIGGVLGFGVGVLGLRVYIHWLLVSRFGAHRLALVRIGTP